MFILKYYQQYQSYSYVYFILINKDSQQKGGRFYDFLLKSMNYESDDTDCVQQGFQQSFDHVDNLETL